jgi:hypothetical protein
LTVSIAIGSAEIPASFLDFHNSLATLLHFAYRLMESQIEIDTPKILRFSGEEEMEGD